jgi:hypothetical protein
LRVSLAVEGWTIEWWPESVDTCPDCRDPIVIAAGLHAVWRDLRARPFVVCDSCADRKLPTRFSELTKAREVTGWQTG